jgi:hypothetical protein
MRDGTFKLIGYMLGWVTEPAIRRGPVGRPTVGTTSRITPIGAERPVSFGQLAERVCRFEFSMGTVPRLYNEFSERIVSTEDGGTPNGVATLNLTWAIRLRQSHAIIAALSDYSGVVRRSPWPSGKPPSNELVDAVLWPIVLIAALAFDADPDVLSGWARELSDRGLSAQSLRDLRSPRIRNGHGSTCRTSSR